MSIHHFQLQIIKTVVFFLRLLTCHTKIICWSFAEQNDQKHLLDWKNLQINPLVSVAF